jgi:hypothetical protein
VDTSLQATLPRVFELKERQPDPAHPDAFFKTNFEQSLRDTPLKNASFERLERQLAALNAGAWADLKERAQKLLQTRHPDRLWQALFDVLNEAIGYAYLQSLGCANVRFIPRTTTKTPDLEAHLDGRLVLCEVKTINISQEEADRRRRIGEGVVIAASVPTRLDEACLGKLTSTLQTAERQLATHDPSRVARRVVCVVLNFDDWVGDYQTEYIGQIDEHLLANPVGAELVFSPAGNLFRRTFSMQSGTVFDPESRS